jgi:hypothetical protein
MIHIQNSKLSHEPDLLCSLKAECLMMVVRVGSAWRDQHLSSRKDSMIILKVLLQALTKWKLHLVHVPEYVIQNTA